VTHSLGKIGDPFGSAGMVESLGFYPGAFWSLMLSLTEFLGGIFIALGFLMHPASLAATFVLLVSGAEKSIL
jgi:putative oxidoreductase